MVSAVVTLTLANHNYPLKDLVAGVVNSAALGTEQVLNGTFADNTIWTFGTGWAHDGSNFEADHSSGTAALQQNVGAVAGELYRLVFTVANRGAGSVTPGLGGVSGTALSANGTSTQYIVASTTGNLTFTPTTDFDGSIDTVSVKRIKSTAAVPLRGRMITLQAPSGNSAAVLVGDVNLSATRYALSLVHTDQRQWQLGGNHLMSLGGYYARSGSAAQTLAVTIS